MSTSAKRLSQKAIDFVDGFFYPLKSSHYLELVNPLWTSHTLQARVEALIDETQDSRTLVLRPGRGWRRHRAGQHVRVGVAINGKRFTRTYSLSSAPEREDGLITMTVKAIAGGTVSHRLVRSMQVGDLLPLGLPQGDFVMPEAVPVKPLFITAGSGITPVMSMLRSLAIAGAMPDCRHLHYARNDNEVIFASELRALGREFPSYKLNLIYTQPISSMLTAVHFTAGQLHSYVPDWRERDSWVCGPASLLDATEQQWNQAGCGAKLRQERFRARLVPLGGDTVGGCVKFLASQVSAEADGRTSLLTVAEKAGLNPAHGCRMGICHGCDVKINAGQVRDLRSGEVVSCEPGQRVQICVVAAAGDVDLEL